MQTATQNATPDSSWDPHIADSQELPEKIFFQNRNFLVTSQETTQTPVSGERPKFQIFPFSSLLH